MTLPRSDFNVINLENERKLDNLILMTRITLVESVTQRLDLFLSVSRY